MDAAVGIFKKTVPELHYLVFLTSIKTAVIVGE